MEAIDIRNLRKTYKDTVAVADLNLVIHKGELFSLLGVNGAGKSTTVKMLTTLTTPTSGDALLLGHSIVHDREKVKKTVGVSPQETAIAEKLTVYENLMLLCGIHGYKKEESKQKADEMLRKFSLIDVKNKRAGKLSGGYKRRLSIALALIGDPEILFLDEPTLGLDVIARSELWEVIRELKNKITVILTTHYMEEAETLSDRIGIMKDGHLIALGTADELKQKAETDSFEQAFINIVKGEVK